MRGIGAELIGGGESTVATELGVASAMEDLGLKGLGCEGAVEDKAVGGSRIRTRATRHTRMAGSGGDVPQFVRGSPRQSREETVRITGGPGRGKETVQV